MNSEYVLRPVDSSNRTYIELVKVTSTYFWPLCAFLFKVELHNCGNSARSGLTYNKRLSRMCMETGIRINNSSHRVFAPSFFSVVTIPARRTLGLLRTLLRVKEPRALSRGLPVKQTSVTHERPKKANGSPGNYTRRGANNHWIENSDN